MSTAIIERHQFNSASTAAGTFPTVTFLTTPVAGDIVVLVADYFTAGSEQFIPSGLGGTWLKFDARDTVNTSDATSGVTTQTVWISRDCNAAGVVNLTAPTTYRGTIHAALLRSSTAAFLSVLRETTSTGNTTTMSMSIPARRAYAGDVVLGVASWSAVAGSGLVTLTGVTETGSGTPFDGSFTESDIAWRVASGTENVTVVSDRSTTASRGQIMALTITDNLQPPTEPQIEQDWSMAIESASPLTIPVPMNAHEFDPTDIVIGFAVYYNGGLPSDYVPSGLGATWTSRVITTTNVHVTMWMGHSPTTPGTLTWTAGTVRQGGLFAFVVRGAASDRIDSWGVDSESVASLTSTAVVAEAGELVVGMGWQSTGSTVTWPSAKTPASGWTWMLRRVAVFGSGSVASRVSGASETHELSQARVSGTSKQQITMLRVGVEGAPNAPVGLVLTPDFTSIEVDWSTPPTGSAPTGYTVAVDGGTPVDVGLVLTHTVTGLISGTNYDIDVRAYNTTGTSAPVSGNTDTLSPPNPPTGLVQTTATTTSVDVAWTAPATGTAPTSYEYRVDGGDPVDVGLVLTAHITALSAGTTYTIDVRSVVAGGTSSWASVNASTEAIPIPDSPTVECYSMVRGSAIRVTELGSRGQTLNPVRYGVSKSVVKVAINEVALEGANEMLSTPEDERRLRFVKSTQTIRYTADIEFLRVDPGILSLVTGVPMVHGASLGFGETPFGEWPFGGAVTSDVIGFDSVPRLAPTAFSLEVWSKLTGSHCVGEPRWGYTLFPFLKGGRLTGFKFHNGLVSFNLIGAQTRRMPRWGVGPHDIEGPFERLITPVSRNTSWRSFVTQGAPPVEFCGIQELTDVLDNGTAANPMPDPAAALFVDSGGVETSAFIIDGGRA